MISAKDVNELRQKTGAGMMDCKKALTECNGDIEAAIDWLREKGISKAAKKADRVAAEGLCNVVTSGNTALLFELNSETDFVSKNEKFLELLESLSQGLLTSDVTDTEGALALVLEGKTVTELLSSATATIGEKITLRRVSKVVKTDSQSFGAYKHQGGRIVSLTVLEGSDEETAKDVAMHVAAINPRFLDQSQISEAEVEKERAILTQEALNEGKPANIVEKMVVGRLNKFLQEICLVNQPFVKNPDLTVAKYVESKKGKVVSFSRLEVGEGIEKVESDFAAEVMAQVKG